MSVLRKTATTVILTVLICLLALATLSCDIDAVPGRFTYIVKYEVTTNVVAPASATVDIDYTDGTPAAPSSGSEPDYVIDADTPWTFEFATPFSYDEGYFYPTLNVVEDAVDPLLSGETVTVKIIWKDYRVDFQEQVLVLENLYNDGSTVIDTVSLTGPELPRP